MRLDKYLSEKFGSRTKAAEAIKERLVLVNGKPASPSYEFCEGEEITFITPDEEFVSNGGYKLSKALKDFDFSPKDLIFADIGASTGGFTDCLLKNGAQKVYCIDVGESQLDERLKSQNVVIVDNFNARNLNAEMFSEELDGVVIDVSFISLTYILKNVSEILGDGKCVIALVKPQFECDKKSIGKGGIVKDPATRKRAVKKIIDYAISCNLTPQNLTTAPLREGKNREYLLLLVKNGSRLLDIANLNKYANF